MPTKGARSEKKPKKPPVWSHQATPQVALAIRELRKVQEEAAMLRKKSAMLTKIIVDGGGGQAHGVRAAVRHEKPSRVMRWVTRKERWFVQFLMAK